MPTLVHRVLASAATAIAVAALSVPVAGSATLPVRTIGVTVLTHQHTDANGRVTETLPSLSRWQPALRVNPQVVATFTSWGNGVDPVAFARAVRTQGKTPQITWESWA